MTARDWFVTRFDELTQALRQHTVAFIGSGEPVLSSCIGHTPAFRLPWLWQIKARSRMGPGTHALGVFSCILHPIEASVVVLGSAQEHGRARRPRW